MKDPKKYSAFPSGSDQYSGMTLRDYFAARAMEALISRGHHPSDVCKDAYQYADAMLLAREAP